MIDYPLDELINLLTGRKRPGALMKRNMKKLVSMLVGPRKLVAKRISRRVALTIMCLGLMFALSVLPQARADGGGQVVPAGALPHGFSLADMAVAQALFLTSGNNMTFYPNTPFQILFAPTSNTQTIPITCAAGGPGLKMVGNNAFGEVRPETPFYVPFFEVDDSPPVVGTFPLQTSMAADYFFGSNQVGGRDFTITVQQIEQGVISQTTPVGAEFLVGPVQTPPLLDGGGTHLVQLAVFLTPLSPGKYIVSFSGQLAGAALAPAIGENCLVADFTYMVTVVPLGSQKAATPGLVKRQ